jgi:hypothetical protein
MDQATHAADLKALKGGWAGRDSVQGAPDKLKKAQLAIVTAAAQGGHVRQALLCALYLVAMWGYCCTLPKLLAAPRCNQVARGLRDAQTSSSQSATMGTVEARKLKSARSLAHHATGVLAKRAYLQHQAAMLRRVFRGAWGRGGGARGNG